MKVLGDEHLNSTSAKPKNAGICQETARSQVWGPVGPSQVSLSTQQKGSNLFILMLIEYNEDTGFSNVGITGDLGESSSVGLVGLEKVSERMRELDQRYGYLVTVCASKGKKKNEAVHGEGSRVKGLFVLKTEEQHVYMLKDRILKREKKD